MTGLCVIALPSDNFWACDLGQCHEIVTENYLWTDMPLHDKKTGRNVVCLAYLVCCPVAVALLAQRLSVTSSAWPAETASERGAWLPTFRLSGVLPETCGAACEPSCVLGWPSAWGWGCFSLLSTEATFSLRCKLSCFPKRTWRTHVSMISINMILE